jgi:hypothetical protein
MRTVGLQLVTQKLIFLDKFIRKIQIKIEKIKFEYL